MTRVGLDYNALFRVAEVYGITVTPLVLEGVQALEAEVLMEQGTDGKNASSKN